MAEIKTDILTKVKIFLDLLSKRGIKVSDAYIFGSYSNNTENELSDIDLAVISDDFDGNMLTDIEKFAGLTRKVDTRISVMPLNNESLDSYFVQKEIIDKGYKIQ